ncbi:MAG: hypothetical protein KFW21_05885 [Spirochaetota bacterium]|nr:hypothetical protein [Spirochaetota bacterium]
MKYMLYSFVFGLLLGGGVIYFFLNKSVPIQASMIISSSNPEANISNQTLDLTKKYTTIIATAVFETDQKGTFTSEIVLNRQDIQYKNSLIFQGGYLINSQTPLLDIAYSYDKLIISAKLGYSFRLKELDYGIGIGGRFSW